MLKFSRFASLDEKRLFVQQADLKPRKGTPYITVKSGIDAGVTTNGYCQFYRIQPVWKKRIKIGVTVKTDVGERASIMCENQLRGLDAVCHTELEKTTIDVIYEGAFD